jgi:DNA-binding CsgD family transcriptional regulator
MAEPGPFAGQPLARGGLPVGASAVNRPIEMQAVTTFLTKASAGPTGLLVEGEVGIGKTTLWLESIDRAREQGFQVLSARPAAMDSGLAYGSAADLLTGVSSKAWADLPAPQRRALDRVLLREDRDPADRRTLAAGLLSLINALTDESPLLLAIDDLQWLDVSSRDVVAYVARRLSGRVGVLGCVRTDCDGLDCTSWLQLPRPDMMDQITVSPLKLGGISRLLSERVGGSLLRSTMVQIWETSEGNPFYALELARAIVDGTPALENALPETLTGLLRTRIGDLGAGVQDVLLAAACVGAPTVELVGLATDADAERVVELLEGAESRGIVTIDGCRVQFAHPLLARSVYHNATPARRRAMHRRLAEVVTQPELRARHLALAATSPDPQTLKTLDAAALIARTRGAPAAAAELLGLALKLGGDTPERRTALARDHLTTGDAARARDLLEAMIDRMPPGPMRGQASAVLASAYLFTDSFAEAAELLERALGDAGDDLALRSRLLVALSHARYNIGDFSGATQSIDDAVADAERLGYARPLSRALRMRVVHGFLRGDGVDEPTLARAFELEGLQAAGPIVFRPSMQNAMLMAWTLRLDDAREQLESIRRRCQERGDEGELIFVDSQRFLIESWRGRFTAASAIADDMVERALQLGGDVPLSMALNARGELAAYAGQEEQARRYIGEAAEAGGRIGADTFAVWPITTLGFLEVSLGNYDAALTVLEPLLTKLRAEPDATEIVVAWFLPHAIDALIALDRLNEAGPLVDILEGNGRRLDRAWMLAVGARCRAMLLAARGDVDAACVVIDAAMTHHERVPMPFEHARTQLLLGQLQRRQRQRVAATATLRESLRAFEAMGVALWADRARAELARAGISGTGTDLLTPSEERVASLAASGLTNRDIAATLFISPKTVEANLGRVYRKLKVQSRAQLSRQLLKAT